MGGLDEEMPIFVKALDERRTYSFIRSFVYSAGIDLFILADTSVVLDVISTSKFFKVIGLYGRLGSHIYFDA